MLIPTRLDDTVSHLKILRVFHHRLITSRERLKLTYYTFAISDLGWQRGVRAGDVARVQVGAAAGRLQGPQGGVHRRRGDPLHRARRRREGPDDHEHDLRGRSECSIIKLTNVYPTDIDTGHAN